jgi:nitrate/nitrite transport system ATP-binding protein
MNRYLELWRITKTYPGPAGPVVIVRDFDLSLREGEFVSLIGHSGCGKSTVLSIAAGLVEASAGGVTVAGREISGPGLDRGVVFQAACLLPWMTAQDNVRLGVDQAFPHRSRAERQAIAQHYLDLVGLDGDRHKRPGELSAGMCQRVGVARAFALHPKVLLLDEPFGMLDSLTRCELQQVLLDLWSQDRKTALMVTHDVDEALFLSDRIALMTSGPEARLGGIVEVPFRRPRHRRQVLEHPEYYVLREQIIGFLEEQGRHPPPDGGGAH